MLPTQEIIEHLAGRIERAYALRRAGWERGCSTPGVWTAAAKCLWQAHVEEPLVPLDSELFVASQPIAGTLGDPWIELTDVEAGHRYRAQVRRIVKRLRRELSREVRRAERFIPDGGHWIVTTLCRDARLSPLGCYIAAERLGRADLSRKFREGATEQHHACPLYRVASESLLPPDRYPVSSPSSLRERPEGIRVRRKSIALN